jgi:hypothetical protein
MRRSRALATTLLPALALAILPAAPATAAAFDARPSDFVAGPTVTLSGTKDAGSTLVIRRDGQIVCTVSDPDALTWQCADLPTPSGVHVFTGDETLADASVVPLAPLTLRVLAAPVLDGAGGSVLTTGRFTGTAVPGASIRLQSTGEAGTTEHTCPAALPSGFWSCVVDLPNGVYQVSARQQSAAIGPEQSGSSTPVSATIDRTPPSAPTITSPRPGTTPLAAVTARGGGERGATLQLFVDGAMVCEAVVSSSGAWQCPLRWPSPGAYTLQALQRDRAGNFSAASARVEVRFSPPADPPSASAPAPPPPGSTPTPKPDPSGAPRPDDPGVPDSPVTPASPPDTNWGTPTGFGASLPTAQQVIDRGGWVLAPVLGLAYLLLIAFPVRAAATHVVPRLPRGRRPTLTGRNRDDLDEASAAAARAPLVLSPSLVAAGTLGGAAVIAALSGGIDAEVRYLRLTAAIGAGLVLLNIIGVLLPARLAARVGGTRAVVRLLPGILLVALVAALISRLGGLQPPLLAGVLIAAAAAAGSGRRALAGVAVAQTSGVAALALLGWAVHDLLSPSTGFWMTLASETAAAVALGGLGSLLMLLLPVGPLPGRTLYAVSPPAWAVIALVSAGVTGAILVAGPAFPLAALTLASAAFAALLTAAVAWVRWVAPAWR